MRRSTGQRARSTGALLALALAVGCAETTTQSAPHSRPSNTEALTPSAALERGSAAYLASRYQDAERLLREAEGASDTVVAARLWLGRLALTTGRYADAAALGDLLAAAGHSEARLLRAAALRAQGRREDAVQELAPAADEPDGHEERLLLGEVLVELGRRAEAEAPLRRLIADYNEDRITSRDGRLLALVGRAAALLRYPADANDAYNEAEQAGDPDDRLLLWRVELYLDQHDLVHASEVLGELLERAPRHPDALALSARAQLAATYDFGAASRLARAALDENPEHVGARAVLAGIAIREGDFALVEQHVHRGLQTDPAASELWALRAAALFVAGDREGFRRVEREALALRPGYARFYAIVSEYAEWEHRYEDIVALTEVGLGLDPDEASVHTARATNLLRVGRDSEGLAALELAHELDPYDVRVFNMLELYDKVIPVSYRDVEVGPFRVRYHRDQEALLSRYVPELLTEAWGVMRTRYRMTPSTPVGVELYPEREHFAVRTVGLPNVGIDGVCFGRTLAAVAPGEVQSNLPMTLWHELGHVFHIQLSDSRVPRWLTEGMAEWETLVRHPEWARELDLELYRALVADRVPAVERLNHAFTHAESLEDMAVAYHAATRIVVAIVELFGERVLVDSLAAIARGAPPVDALATASGLDREGFERRVRERLLQDLSRFDGQFVPPRVRAVRTVRPLADAAPEDEGLQLELALALVQSGDDGAAAVVERLLRRDADAPGPVYAAALAALRRKDWDVAADHLGRLREHGARGLHVEALAARIAAGRGRLGDAVEAWQRASDADPGSIAALDGWLAAARQAGDESAMLRALTRWSGVGESDLPVHLALAAAALERGDSALAVAAAERAVRADLTSLPAHESLAGALASSGDRARALFEAESAALCGGSAADQARVSELLRTLR